MQRHGLQGARSRVKGGRYTEPRQHRASGFQQTHTGVTSAQMAADFVLELVPGLRRVPARLPGEWNLLTVFLAAGIAFHGEGKSRILVLRLARLMHADIGAHGGATAVTMRLTGQLEALDAEGGVGRGFADARQQAVAGSNGSGHRIQLGPVERLALQGAVQRMQPAPAFANQDIAVVIARLEHLEEALSTAFETDQ